VAVSGFDAMEQEEADQVASLGRLGLRFLASSDQGSDHFDTTAVKVRTVTIFCSSAQTTS
jgi:hypothetical protein